MLRRTTGNKVQKAILIDLDVHQVLVVYVSQYTCHCVLVSETVTARPPQLLHRCHTVIASWAAAIKNLGWEWFFHSSANRSVHYVRASVMTVTD